MKCCLDQEVVSVGTNFNCVGIIGCLEPFFLCFLDFFLFPPFFLDFLVPEELELLEYQAVDDVEDEQEESDEEGSEGSNGNEIKPGGHVFGSGEACVYVWGLS